MTELSVGEEVAGYRVIERVGAGGMGRVYRALHVPLERIVALKVIRSEIAADESFRERFRHELRLIASVDHPSVVPVYDADEVDGVLFIAMRWVAGPDLRRVIAGEGGMAPARAVHLLGQIAAAVDAAHSVGLVHRDIKPANVLLEGERAFLSDFGLARLLTVADATTVTRGFVGTVDYAAPELLDGEQGAAAADIYALGCVLFEMLTGSVPFPIETLLAKVHAHAHRDRPVPSRQRPELPRGLDGVVRRALAIDPGARFATAGELSAAAAAGLRTAPASRATGARRRRARWVMAVGLSAAAATLAIMTGLFSASPPPYAPGGHNLPTTRRRGSVQHPSDCCKIEAGGEGHVVRMRTMTVEVTGVRRAGVLPISPTGGEVTAPRGTRFVIVDLSVTNTTDALREFQPSQSLTGDMTTLLLINSRGGTMTSRGPNGMDYALQDYPTTGAKQSPLSFALTEPLYQTELAPGRLVHGQLVFVYPTAELRAARGAELLLNELGASIVDVGTGARISVDL